MGMNSFSLRAEQNHNSSDRPYYEKEISELLNLHGEGEVFTLDLNSKVKNLKYKPLDFSSLRDEWEDAAEQRTPKFELKTTVLIANHKKAFRTQSENLSKSGLLLKDLLPPEFLEKQFEIVLIHTDSSQKKTFLLFRGKAFGRGAKSRRIEFQAMTANSEFKLHQLLERLPQAA